MPRQDVPYGGAICRLKERIAEIWDKLDEKLHSINGVEGDGAGNVEIVSGDAAITVSESPTGHFIEIGLDHGNLPSAAVSSVNGQTGAVRLDAADIPSDGNSNVQADIAANKAAINECFDAITSEQLARQNADAALQTNINSVSANIPEMSMTPDPYKGIERDAQGRAFAADPENGATDKTLVTANWVSQTGDSGPNNLMHKRGNETKKGKLNLEDTLTLYNPNWETAPTTVYKKNFDSTTPPTAYQSIGGGFTIRDANNRIIWQFNAYRDINGLDVLSIQGLAYDNSSGYFHLELGPNNYRKITTNFDKPSNW